MTRRYAKQFRARALASAMAVAWIGLNGLDVGTSNLAFGLAAIAGPGHDHGQEQDHEHKAPGADKATAGTDDHDGRKVGDEEGLVRLSAAQIAASGIETAPVGPGVLANSVPAPGVIAPDSDRIARIAAKVIGTVAVLHKRLGDTVAAGETVAVLDSREVAEARSEYFAAMTNLELQKTLFEREQALWDRKVSAEQVYLRARNALREVELRVALAVQKLAALGLRPPQGQIAPSKTGLSGETTGAAPDRPPTSADGTSRVSPDQALPGELLQQYALRSPIAGRVIERRVDRGAPVGGEGQEKEIYVIADLSHVWVDLAAPQAQLASIRDGQKVRVTGSDGATGEGQIVFISPVLNPETRAARVIARLDNTPLRWRPGGFVAARIITGAEPAALLAPRAAIQTINNHQVVFVQTPEGFRLREISTGRGDDTHVAVTSGLQAGERIATRNVFLLKAELGKSEAAHAH